MKPLGQLALIKKNNSQIIHKTNISILIPYSRPNKIRECIESIKSSRVSLSEVVVGDTLGDFEPKNFDDLGLNIVVLRFTESDISNVYKGLVTNSTGEYIYFLEDDDLLMPPFTSAFRVIKESKSDLGICNYFGYEGLQMDFCQTRQADFEDFKKSFPHYKKFQLGRIIIKKSLIQKFPKNNNLLNDWHLFAHLSPKRFLILPYSIYKQRVDDTNISFNIREPYFESEIPTMENICK